MNVPAPKNRHSPRLLVVDDIEPIRWMLAELFELEGYEVEQAANAQEALALARLVRWDGLILDVDMPGMNGLELYVNLMRLNADACLPVIFFTGRPNGLLEASLADVAWASCISKPCEPRQLVAHLRQCLLAGGKRPPPTPDAV
jgi:DNA-binding response OmpR family regulator